MRGHVLFSLNRIFFTAAGHSHEQVCDEKRAGYLTKPPSEPPKSQAAASSSSNPGIPKSPPKVSASSMSHPGSSWGGDQPKPGGLSEPSGISVPSPCGLFLFRAAIRAARSHTEKHVNNQCFPMSTTVKGTETNGP